MLRESSLMLAHCLILGGYGACRCGFKWYQATTEFVTYRFWELEGTMERTEIATDFDDLQFLLFSVHTESCFCSLVFPLPHPQEGLEQPFSRDPLSSNWFRNGYMWLTSGQCYVKGRLLEDSLSLSSRYFLSDCDA